MPNRTKRKLKNYEMRLAQYDALPLDKKQGKKRPGSRKK